MSFSDAVYADHMLMHGDRASTKDKTHLVQGPGLAVLSRAGVSGQHTLTRNCHAGLL